MRYKLRYPYDGVSEQLLAQATCKILRAETSPHRLPAVVAGREGLSGRIVGIETVDKITDRQIAAKVRQHFRK